MVQQSEQIDYVQTLPTRWSNSLDAFDQGKILPRYFGKAFHELFSQCRREEEGRYNAVMPDKDFEWYMRAV